MVNTFEARFNKKFEGIVNDPPAYEYLHVNLAADKLKQIGNNREMHDLESSINFYISSQS